MKDFFLNALLYPFLAILFCLAFGLPFVYTGFQTVTVRGSKDPDGVVSIDFSRKHFWGLVRVERHLEEVENASLQTSRVRRIRTAGSTHSLVSGVFINTAEASERLLAGSSNVNDALKWDAVESINDFISNSAQVTFQRTFRVLNVFGWVGLPFLAIGILGLIGWPSSILRYHKSD